jgi:catechol 2,3-dioxygenase-like lactoylglutathione lyase family enzyme
MITRFDHLQLAMPPGEEHRARAFFRDLIGMREDPKPEPLASRGGCWFSGSGAHVHLGVENDFVPQKKAHPAFCVRDLDELARRLMAAAFPVAWDDALPARRRFYTSDPFGNRIEFIQEGDGFSQRPD